MKIGLILILFFHFIEPTSETVMIEIRDLYERAPVNESAYKKLNNMLETAKLDDELLEGYKGATAMIGAEHVFNPITKLSRFNRGKKILEKAVRNDLNNLELRYLRLTIQTNLPKLLGYSNAIQTDKQLIIKNLEATKDIDLKNRVIDYLMSSNICSADELRKIRLWKKK